MLGTKRFSPSPSLSSRSGPYAELRDTARKLSGGLESRARECQSASERRRLLVLSAAAFQIVACLENTGVKHV
jgi:hypothetical protein